ncbi:MAG: hypothetical protein FJ146_18650 [Deltaproteobacteria bacterium]|nr:hypothetical protein [Deltaproteobacteria bacterium]
MSNPKSKLSMFILINAALISITTACGGNQSGDTGKAPNAETPMTAGGLKAGMFDTAWLTAYASWTPVLSGDKALKSDGHGGIWVHSYLNDRAAMHAATASNPFPLPEGAVLAKAVVPAETSNVTTDVTRVYFMKKEKTGYDLEHANWSYAVATLVNGRLTYDASVAPRQGVCVSCHAKFNEYDYAKTVDIYRKRLGK